MKKNTVKGLIFLFLAAIVWGLAFVAQRVGADSISPMYFNGVRFFIGGLSLIPVILLFEKGADDKGKKKTTLWAGILAGIVLAVASFLQQVGVELTDSAGKSGFITGLYMILVPIIGLFFGAKSKAKTWIGAILGILGLFMICMNGTKMTFTAGDLFLIADAVMFAFHIIIIDHFGDRVYSLRFSMVQFFTTAVISMGGALIFEEVTFEPLVLAIIPILYCGIMSVGVGYTFQVLGQKYSEPTSAAIILSTEAVWSAIFGAIILSERMGVIAYIGCALIFAGIIVTQLKTKE